MKKTILILMMFSFVFFIAGCEEQGAMPQEATNEETSDIEFLEKGGYWHDHGLNPGIMKIPENYAKAFETNDIELFAALWDENGIQMPPDAPHVVGIEAIRAGAEPMFANFYLDMEITVMEARAVSKKWGFMWGVYNFTATPIAGGEGFAVDGKFSTIVKKRDRHDPHRKKLGPWKAYIDCFNSNVP